MITYGSVCSGIEAATVAWHPLGWMPSWFAEIEPFPAAVLAHHYPHVANLGDMTQIAMLIRMGFVNAPDVLVGGTPCQAFSVAGVRRGLADPRGQLTLAYADLANAIDEKRPGKECLIYWENVPGVLSSQDNAFGCFLGLLAGEDSELTPELKPADGKNSKFWKWNKNERTHTCRWPNVGCVYGPQRAIAWRVFDAQYFGVAQRRRRVFLVASARAGFDPAKLLFESDGVRRDSPPSREAGETVAGTLESRTSGGGFPGTGSICAGHIQAVTNAEGSQGLPLRTVSNIGKHVNNQTPLVYGFQPRIARNGRGDMGDLCHTLSAQSGETGKGDAAPCVAIAHVETMPTLRAGSPIAVTRSGDCKDEYIVPIAWSEELTALIDVAGTIQYGGQGGRHDGVMTSNMAVRRLLPVECERLQSFPDNYTLIPIKNKLAADGPRYKALGNSMCVKNMQWLGVRLMITHSHLFS